MKSELSEEEVVFHTKVGKMVQRGEITSIDEIFRNNLRITEPQIVDILLPDLEEEVVDVNLVQKQTDAGEKTRFRVVVVVGNRDGYVGVGKGVAQEIGPAIRSAISKAKMNIYPVRRGCGSWICGCKGENHSIPFKVKGKCGSVRVELIPAPKGVGLVSGEKAKVVFRLCGIKDIWTKTKGDTRTTINFVKAVFDALKNTYRVVTKEDWGVVE